MNRSSIDINIERFNVIIICGFYCYTVTYYILYVYSYFLVDTDRQRVSHCVSHFATSTATEQIFRLFRLPGSILNVQQTCLMDSIHGCVFGVGTPFF